MQLLKARKHLRPAGAAQLTRLSNLTGQRNQSHIDFRFIAQLSRYAERRYISSKLCRSFAYFKADLSFYQLSNLILNQLSNLVLRVAPHHPCRRFISLALLKHCIQL